MNYSFPSVNVNMVSQFNSLIQELNKLDTIIKLIVKKYDSKIRDFEETFLYQTKKIEVIHNLFKKSNTFKPGIDINSIDNKMLEKKLLACKQLQQMQSDIKNLRYPPSNNTQSEKIIRETYDNLIKANHQLNYQNKQVMEKNEQLQKKIDDLIIRMDKLENTT